MSSKCLAVLGLAGLVGGTPYALAQPSLGDAASFAVLGNTVNNVGETKITGNLGGTVANPPKFIAGGVRNDLAPFARADATAAYNALSAGTCAPLPDGVVPPAVYCVSSFGGTLTLSGDKHGVWIFRATNLTTAPDTIVRVTNGGWEGNVFWQVSGSATLGASTVFIGNLLAHDDITFGTGASLSGRALALTGNVTLDSNKISLCCDAPISLAPGSLPDGSVDKPYTATFSASGGKEPYTYRITTSIPGLTSFSNTLAFTPTADGTVTVSVTATDDLGCQATNDYTITIACSTIVVLPSATPQTVDVPYDLPRGKVGEQYKAMLTTKCSTPPVTCLRTAGTLPPGVELVDCTLIDIPTSPGLFEFTVTASDNGVHAAGRQKYKIVVCGPQLPDKLPDGCVGVPYSATIPGAVFSGNIPPGVKPLGNTLRGTPTEAGCFDVTVTVTDSNGCTASRVYRICICGPLTPNTMPPLPTACLNVPYNARITATGGAPRYRFTTPVQPSPFFLSPDGTITGTPTIAGCTPDFIVTVTDSIGNSASAPYKICVSTAVDVIPITLPPATPGVYYEQNIEGTGGTPGYTLTHSGTIPFGLKFNDATGLLYGFPKTGSVGALMMPSAPFSVTATDKNGCSGTRVYTLTLTCSSVALSPAALPSGNVAAPYAQLFIATGGAPPYTFTVVSGSLPPGLTLDSGGAIGGTPTTPGTYCFEVTVTDAGGCGTGLTAYAIVINSATCPAGTTIVVSPSALPFAPTGMPYAQAITAVGGTPPYTFTVTAGNLPPGLTLNSITGLLSGTPTTGGRYTFTITATDANGCVGSMAECSVALTVDMPALSHWAIVLLSLVLSTLAVAALRR